MRMRATLPAALLAAALLAGPARAGDPAQGAALAQERGCGACHGARGVSAQLGIPSLAGQQPDFVTLQLILFRERLRDAPPMPDLAQGLSDEQVEDLAAYYASLPAAAAEDRGPRREAAMQEGAQLAQTLRCGICHTADFHGQAQVPRIAGQREEYLAEALVRYRDGKRHGSDTNMNAVMYGVTDAQVAVIAHFMAQQP